jgi:hypothetical protein
MLGRADAKIIEGPVARQGGESPITVVLNWTAGLKN